jgi:predicted DNA-binding protein (MmcQ/YjbR family)
MDAERARKFLLGLPDVVETQQWGDNLVYWVGDKAVGGKMFALISLSGGLTGGGRFVVSFASDAEGFAVWVEQESIFPAPYLARAKWVAAERWDAMRDTEWREALTQACEIVRAKLPPKAKRVLLLSKSEQRRVIAAARSLREKKKL